jgi:hypothetical protein
VASQIFTAIRLAQLFTLQVAGEIVMASWLLGLITAPVLVLA